MDYPLAHLITTRFAVCFCASYTYKVRTKDEQHAFIYSSVRSIVRRRRIYDLPLKNTLSVIDTTRAFTLESPDVLVGLSSQKHFRLDRIC